MMSIQQMLVLRGEVPGCPAAGHMDGGYWHPGPRAGCPKGSCTPGRGRTGPPHCRSHLEFRSDCENCVSEREFS